MPHETTIIHKALMTPVTENEKWKVWHALIVCLIVGFTVGALVL